MGADSMTMKKWNKSSVRRQLRLKQTATKQEIAAETGLSVVTVNALLCEMIKDGEAQQGNVVSSGGGRPSMQYSYNENYGLAVIVYGHKEQGKNRIHMLAVNLYGECLTRKDMTMEKIGVHSFEKELDDFFESYSAIRLLAFGMPGVEEDGNVIVNDYPELVGTAFLQNYQDRYGIPVLFENDVNAAVRGYYEKSGKQGEGNVAGIYFPKSDSPGAGILLSGRVYHGIRNFAGEVGSIEVPFDWVKMDYEDVSQVAPMAGRLAVMYCCIMAPEGIVMYGSFWKPESREAVLSYVRGRLPENVDIEIVFSDTFMQDFEKGMIGISLERMEEKI